MIIIQTMPKPALDRADLWRIREAYGFHPYRTSLAKPVETAPAAWEAARQAEEARQGCKLVKFFRSIGQACIGG